MKWHGILGVYKEVEVRPSVWKPQIVPVECAGEFLSYGRRNQGSTSTNGETVLNGRISIIASDPWLAKELPDIKYAEWRGIKWTVTNITPEPPRLLLDLGGRYNG